MTEATVFVGGRVYTGSRYAEALLIEGDRVVAVGEAASVRRQAPSGADRYDLAGGLLLPGLADAHLHLGELARSREAMDAGFVGSVGDLQERLRSYARGRPEGPLVAMGLSLELLAERRWPTPAELDRAVRDRPLVVYHASGHAAVPNSEALASLPPSFAPSVPGLLREEELQLVRPLLERAAPLSRQALGETAQALSRFGLTAVGAVNAGTHELTLLDELAASGDLPLRVRAYPPAPTRGPLPSFPVADAGASVAVVGSKAFLDGAFGPRTAALDEPYSDAPTTCGIERGEDRDLGAWVEACRGAGLVPALHAIGDKAVRRATHLLSSRSEGPCGARIEHASLTPPPLLELLRRSRPWVVVQPGFVVSDHWLPERLGWARARWAYAFRSLLDVGVPVAGSSDAPFDSPDPWWGMRAAVERRDAHGRSANPTPDQALPEAEALRLYSEGAHRALGLEASSPLAPGSPAELVVLAAPTLTEGIRRGARAVRSTWWRGRPVFEAPAPAGGRG